MEVQTMKIGNQVGIVFPNESQIIAGNTYNIWLVDEKIVLSPKKDIFSNPDDWLGFKEGISQEEIDWERMN